ncbi:TRAP transporter small permease subunit [Castellaniella sp. GW247-6E4]|uniref:TRAP transporter small permease subunit n=1 Tax=Castellaniella sp. GW247-6E4 TaxID=3140380 RepID=UPI0033151F6C
MRALLLFSGFVDRLSAQVGKWVYRLVLVTVLISAFNAVIRKVFRYSSNGLLEIQWYLFAAVFLLGAGYTLMRNEHVRVDVLAGRLSARAQAWIDIFGTVFFLLPMVVLICWLSWPQFVESFVRAEVSSNTGGLIVWPARLLIPVGFFLLGLQALSELIKRIAYLRGMGPDPRDQAGRAPDAAAEGLAGQAPAAAGDVK